MSVNSKMTAIADKIRALLGISGTMGLDAMAANLDTEQTNVSAAFTAIGSKGGTVPTAKVSGNLASAIGTIPEGSAAAPVLQQKTATPSKSEQTVRPDSGYDGLSQVSISAIPDDYIIPSGTKSVTQNGTYDVTAYKSVSVNVASSGVTVQRKAGTLTTNTSGTATVNVGFKPDIVLFTDLFFSPPGNFECQAAAVFSEKKSGYSVMLHALSDNFLDGVVFVPAQTSNGFSVDIFTVTSSGTQSPVRNAQFPYVAIKYTA